MITVSVLRETIKTYREPDLDGPVFWSELSASSVSHFILLSALLCESEYQSGRRCNEKGLYLFRESNTSHAACNQTRFHYLDLLLDVHKLINCLLRTSPLLLQLSFQPSYVLNS